MSKCLYLFPNADFKFRNWAATLPEELFVASHGAYWNLLLLIIKFRSQHKRIIVFYRYLNVSKGFFHESAKLFIDVIIVLLGAFKVVEIRWILHNVENESERRYSSIVNLKRLILSRVAKYFYVTSDIMREHFPYNNSKLRIVSFGEEYSSKTKTDGTKKVVRIMNNWKAGLKILPNYIGIVTNWGAKEQESLKLINLILANNTNGSIGLVYIGRKANIESDYLLEINERYEYFLKDLKVDFALKTLDDKSVPYTLYSAATAGIPLISSSNSYFSKDLHKHGLGGTIDSIEDIISTIENYDIARAKVFLDKHTWLDGAKSLIE